jgi:hypothetical protein
MMVLFIHVGESNISNWIIAALITSANTTDLFSVFLFNPLAFPKKSNRRGFALLPFPIAARCLSVQRVKGMLPDEATDKFAM